MARTIQQILDSLNPSYDQERGLVNQQLSAIPGQETAAIAAADAQKDLAFNQIRNNANASGMLFSGQGIDNSQKYVAANYAPEVAKIKANTQNQQFSLQSSLADIARRQNEKAQGIYNAEVDSDRENAYRQQQLQQEREKMAQQAALERQRIAASSAKAKAANPAKGYAIKKNSAGGVAFTGPNGVPVTAAQYAAVTGTNVRNLLATYGGDGAKKVLQLLDDPKVSDEELMKRYPYIFGGV